jgi:archaellum component FlaC
VTMMKEKRGLLAVLKENKELITYLLTVAVLFGGGLGLGYYIWGMPKVKKPDYKKYLRQTIEYIDKIEDGNKTFVNEIKTLKTDVAVLKKTIAETQQKLDAETNTLKVKSDDLENAKALYSTTLTEKEALVNESSRLKTEIEALTQKLNALKPASEEASAEAPDKGEAAGDEAAEAPTVKEQPTEVEARGKAEAKPEQSVSESNAPAVKSELPVVKEEKPVTKEDHVE